MEATKAEVEQAIRDLNFSDAELRELPGPEARSVYNAAESRFVVAKGRQWWWEDLSVPAANFEFPRGDGFRFLNLLVPSTEEILWFIIETDQKDSAVVYEGRIGHIQKILEECFAFEYYLVPKDFSWLVCENHHNVVFALGAEVERRLREIEIQQAIAADAPGE
jgi:Family of unknown function (DUF6756)